MLGRAEVVQQQLSVRQLEAMIHAEPRDTSKKAPAPQPLESELAAKWGLGVKLKQSERGAGTLTLAFKSKADLDRVLAALR